MTIDDACWWLFLLLGCGALVQWVMAFDDDWLWSISRTKAEPTPSPTVFNDPSFFMPHTTCPNCKVEGLHWMEAPDFEAAELMIKWHGGELTCECALCSEHPGDVAAARELLESRPDVIRTCRECKHEWPQNIGLREAA